MRRIVRRILLVLIVAAVTATIVISSLAREVPTWYAPPDPKDEQVSLLADRVEYRLVEETQRARPGEEIWTVRVREEQINAWLSARLPQWLAHRDWKWPSKLGTPQVRLLPAMIELALPVGTAPEQHVVIAHLRPEVRDGQLWLKMERVLIGGLIFPGDPLEALVALARDSAFSRHFEGADLEPLLDLLAGRAPVDAVIELSDDRIVQVIDVQCTTGALDLTSLTLHEAEVKRAEAR